MNKATDSTLELLAESELALSPGVIHHNLQRLSKSPPSRSTVYRAIDPLADYGLIKVSDSSDNYYVITERGLQY
ncbi:hypothetical protein, partial [Haloferax profundi]|uniref:hypothetical protein n=1 Tax=Haloferax profundi TaxID=1544718 RepID=UPI001E2E2D4C